MKERYTQCDGRLPVLIYLNLINQEYFSNGTEILLLDMLSLMLLYLKNADEFLPLKNFTPGFI